MPRALIEKQTSEPVKTPFPKNTDDPTPRAVPVQRTPILLAPDGERILFKPYVPGDEAVCQDVAAKVLHLPKQQVELQLRRILNEFDHHQFDLEGLLTQRFQQLRQYLNGKPEPEHTRQALIGAYFLLGYTFESAALFNPSIVPHPDQEGVTPGSVRFVMSLRAIGEGHVSSIEFRSGIIDGQCNVNMDTSPSHIAAPMEIELPRYDRQAFRKSLHEMGLYDQFATEVMDKLELRFTSSELLERIDELRVDTRSWSGKNEESARRISFLAQCSYIVRFSESVPLNQRVIHPPIAAARQGVEDARFVRFREDDGSFLYYATYTAWDGQGTFPQLLETQDFTSFRMRTLRGRAAKNKGLALFPRRIGGKYAMISRADNRNLFLMYSDEIDLWQEARPLAQPQHDWEFVKIGNCGSPIETDAGWILLTHGVGAMRRYCIGAMLLDLDDPSKVIGRLATPLLQPAIHGNKGYVPDVVYSCGAMLHQGNLILPYAISDEASTVAIIRLSDLLSALKSS
jgi:predicted GH43/DUF377 family glycosyl hydrolase